MKLKSLLITILIQLVLIVVIIFGVLQFLDYYTRHGEVITVPNLEGMSVEQARDELNAKNIRLEVIDTVDFTNKIPPLSISWQDPKPNDQIKEERTIYAKINAKNYAYVRLPKLESRSLNHAKSNLDILGLKLGETTYEPDYGKDVVLRVEQNGRILREGDKVQKNSKINLVLGDGSLGYQIERQYIEKDEYEDAAPTIDSIF